MSDIPMFLLHVIFPLANVSKKSISGQLKLKRTKIITKMITKTMSKNKEIKYLKKTRNEYRIIKF